MRIALLILSAIWLWAQSPNAMPDDPAHRLLGSVAIRP